MTKLRKTSTALLLSAALLLGGCAEQRPASASRTETNTSSDMSDHNSTNLGNPNYNENSEHSTDSESEPDLKTLIEKFPLDSFIALDGIPVNKSEAIYAHGVTDNKTNVLGFDFAFIRYAQPIFYNTLDNADVIDLVDTQTYKTKEDPEPITNLNYMRVKIGDKLKNGLTVKYADYHIGRHGEASSTEVSLEGEMTLEGILFSYPENYDHNYPKGYLTFYADPTKCDSFPIFGYDMASKDTENVSCFVDPEREFAIVGENTNIRFNNFDRLLEQNYSDISPLLEEVVPGVSKIIDPGEYVKVRITIKDIYAHYFVGTGGGVFATLVSVEPIRQ